MNRTIPTLALLLGLVLPCRGGEVPAIEVVPKKERRADPSTVPTVSLPATLTVKPDRYFTLKATTNCASLRWIIPDGLDRFPVDSAPNTVVLAGAAGTYTVQAYGALGDQASDLAVCVVTIGTPVPPVPPEPPTPPDPGPFTGGSKTAKGIYCLILYDAEHENLMPKEQQLILYAGAIRDYLNAKGVVGPDGKTKEWRIWSDIVDPSLEGGLWPRAMAREKSRHGYKTPWIAVTNGRSFFEGPLPATVDDTMKLLTKYGGP